MVDMIKKCTICGREFRVYGLSSSRYEKKFSRSPRSLTCSPECSRKLYIASVVKGSHKYCKTKKGKAVLARAMKKYSQTPKGKAAIARAGKKYRLKKRNSKALISAGPLT